MNISKVEPAVWPAFSEILHVMIQHVCWFIIILWNEVCWNGSEHWFWALRYTRYCSKYFTGGIIPILQMRKLIWTYPGSRVQSLNYYVYGLLKWKLSLTFSGYKKQDLVHNTIEYFSAIKRNEVLIHATTWIDHENIMLSERSQT